MAARTTEGAPPTRGLDGDNIALVHRFYAALDDVPALLALTARDIEVRYPAEGALPYGGGWRGLDGLVRFLEAHDQAEEILDFEQHDFVGDGDRVVDIGFYRGRAKPSGRVWSTEFVHAFTVRAGRVTMFQAFFDTAAALEAHGHAG